MFYYYYCFIIIFCQNTFVDLIGWKESVVVIPEPAERTLWPRWVGERKHSRRCSSSSWQSLPLSPLQLIPTCLSSTLCPPPHHPTGVMHLFMPALRPHSALTHTGEHVQPTCSHEKDCCTPTCPRCPIFTPQWVCVCLTVSPLTDPRGLIQKLFLSHWFSYDQTECVWLTLVESRFASDSYK